MNRRGDKHGRVGVRMRSDGTGSKRYRGRVRFRGEDIHTRYYATADQAALAYEIMEAVMRFVAETPTLSSQDGEAP